MSSRIERPRPAGFWRVRPQTRRRLEVPASSSSSADRIAPGATSRRAADLSSRLTPRAVRRGTWSATAMWGKTSLAARLTTAPRRPGADFPGLRTGSRSRPTDPGHARSDRRRPLLSMTTCIQVRSAPKSPRSLRRPLLPPLLTECGRFAILGGGVARKRPPSLTPSPCSLQALKLFFGRRFFSTARTPPG
jgi:hypothetical protein